MQTAIGQSIRRKRKLESAIKNCTDKQQLKALEKQYRLETIWYNHLSKQIK